MAGNDVRPNRAYGPSPIPLLWLFALLAVSACGGATTSERGTTESTMPAATRADPRMHAALDPLRPAGSQRIFARLEANPRDARALADGAALYADTGARGMALIWAQMALLLEPDDRRAEALAGILRHTLEAGISRDGETIETHLAPGAAPILSFSDGTFEAPFAYLLEQSIASIGADAGSYENAVQILRMMPRMAGHGPLGSAETELSLYLRTLTEHGLVDAYAHWALGPAYPNEWLAYRRLNEPTVQTMLGFVAEHPFAPTEAVRPDDLRPVRR